jgi:hypothetical protein
MEIRVKHAASRESLDHAQLLNPQQDKRRPDVIKELDRNKQNPKWNLVLLALRCKRDTVMADKHFSLLVEAFVPNAFGFGA